MKRTLHICLFMLVLLLGIAGCDSSTDVQPASSPSKQAGDVSPPDHNAAGDEAGTSGGAPPVSPSRSGLTDEPGSDAANAPPAVKQGLSHVEQWMQELTLEEKVGQLVVIGLEGTAPDATAQRLLEQYHVGGFIFFGDNIESVDQTLELTGRLKQLNGDHPVPLWLSLDEEGGRVSRLPPELGRLPSSGKLGQTNDSKLAADAGTHIAKLMKALGMNLVYTPVLDINSNPDNPVIGDRSFGSESERVSQLGLAQMKAIREEGVIPVVKHFPGHGDTAVDSHTGLPVITHSWERLKSTELVPFQKAIEQGAEMVMVAHLLMTSIDPDTPASLSRHVIHDLLRKEMEYDGVIITDDLTMGAITEAGYDIGDAAVQSILAGCNIVLVGHDYKLEEAVLKSLLEAVQQGEISEEVLDERVKAVLQLKHAANLGAMDEELQDLSTLNQETRRIWNAVKP